jgi:hypothetical protein
LRTCDLGLDESPTSMSLADESRTFAETAKT